jgi:hypothetical protein
MAPRRIALGLRPHTGWAALVALEESPEETADGGRDRLHLVGRRRVSLLAEDMPRQVFHLLRGLELTEAQRRVEHVRAAATEAATAVLTDDGIASRPDIVGIGVVAWQPSVPDGLDRVLRSHQLMHAAEGDLYRTAILDAADALGIPAHCFLPSALTTTAASLIGTSASWIGEQLQVLGRQAGPPWQKDQKESALAAWSVLHIAD